MTALRIGLVGGTGRMGQALQAALADAEDAALAAILSRRQGPEPGRTTDLERFLESCDVVVDFSSPDRLAVIADGCARMRRPLVSGTTGLDDVAREALAAAALQMPVVHAPNMSIGINILLHLVEQTGQILPEDWRVKVEEIHHVHKRDAPSGTALALGGVLERLLGQGSVGYEVHREGEAIGHHWVHFDGPGERLVLSHEATDRGIFAHGALEAARWVVSQPPGLYGMAQVLGLK